MNFSQAYTRLQEIHILLSNGTQLDVAMIVALQSESQMLYTLCQGELMKIKPSTD